MKRIIAILTAALMSIVLLAGCGGKNGDAAFKLEDPDKCPEDSYEINWYLMGDTQKDAANVEEKINDYLKDKINATVKLNFLASSQYSQKLTTMINANEYFDLCFVARWMLDYVNNSRAGAFVKLDDYLDKYMPGITEQYGKENLEFAKVDGGLYALPVYKEMEWQYGWIYRKDLAEKYNIDMSEIKSFKDLEPALKIIKENEKDIKYPLDWQNDTTPAALEKMTEISIDTYIGRDNTKNAGKTYNFYNSDEYKDACRLAYDYYNKGYIRPDILTSSSELLSRMKEGKTFVMLYQLKPGKADELFGSSAYEFEQVEITPPTIDRLAGTGSMQAISSSSKNPVRVMRFLELLNTDPYLKNLVLFGIEGKHYEKTDDKTVKPIEGSGYDIHDRSWSVGNVFIDYLTTDENPEKLTRLRQFNESDQTSDLDKLIYRFLPKEDAEGDRIKTEIGKVVTKYHDQCQMGAVDPDTLFDEFNEQLEAVGMNTILKMYQKEFDDFRKNFE